MMSTAYGERLATLLDKGLNLIPLLPDNCIIGARANYFGQGEGVLLLEQAPSPDNSETRARILGAIAGRAAYTDEPAFYTALSNNMFLPDGTPVQLVEPETEDIEFELPRNALEASHDIASFVRTVAGNLRNARLGFDTNTTASVRATVSGIFTTDEMRAAYLKTIARGFVIETHTEPTTAEAMARIIHSVLTPTGGHIVHFSMRDHRPDAQADMIRLR